MRGHNAPLEVWVDAYAARLYRAAALFTSEVEAADLCQEVFLIAARKQAGFDGRSTPYTWLYGILRNLVRDQRKKRARRTLKLVKPEVPQVAQGLDPERDMSALQDQARVRAAVTRLPDAQRAIVTLFYLEALSVTEVAQRMSLAPGTVKSRLFAARGALRRTLEEA